MRFQSCFHLANKGPGGSGDREGAADTMFVFSSDCDKSLSEADESVIIIEAIQEASLSKFLPEDAPPFEKIMEDTFPGVTVSKVRHLALEVTQPWQALPGPLRLMWL